MNLKEDCIKFNDFRNRLVRIRNLVESLNLNNNRQKIRKGWNLNDTLLTRWHSARGQQHPLPPLPLFHHSRPPSLHHHNVWLLLHLRRVTVPRVWLSVPTLRRWGTVSSLRLTIRRGRAPWRRICWLKHKYRFRVFCAILRYR